MTHGRRYCHGSIFVMSSDVFNVAIENIAKSIERIHADALVVLQPGNKRFADIIFCVQRIFGNTFFFHGVP